VLDVYSGDTIRLTMEEHAPTAIRRRFKWLLSWGKTKESNAPVLLPLTPKYDPQKHGVYFDVIEAALSDSTREARNIALTGSYGVGKSSILTEVAERRFIRPGTMHSDSGLPNQTHHR
jgi:hypothetical protein